MLANLTRRWRFMMEGSNENDNYISLAQVIGNRLARGCYAFLDGFPD